eukprot:937993-Prymnesium_polylepis.1
MARDGSPGYVPGGVAVRGAGRWCPLLRWVYITISRCEVHVELHVNRHAKQRPLSVCDARESAQNSRNAA